MAASYAFAVGSVRAREGALLTRQEMEQLMAAGSERELADRLQLIGLDVDKNAIQRIESRQRFVTDIELVAFSKVFHKSFDALLAPPEK